MTKEHCLNAYLHYKAIAEKRKEPQMVSKLRDNARRAAEDMRAHIIMKWGDGKAILNEMEKPEVPVVEKKAKK